MIPNVGCTHDKILIDRSQCLLCFGSQRCHRAARRRHMPESHAMDQHCACLTLNFMCREHFVKTSSPETSLSSIRSLCNSHKPNSYSGLIFVIARPSGRGNPPSWRLLRSARNDSIWPLVTEGIRAGLCSACTMNCFAIKFRHMLVVSLPYPGCRILNQKRDHFLSLIRRR